MEQDKQIKEILLNSAKIPSADFTAAVMQRIAAAATPFHYQPLVSPKLRRVFVYIFSTLIIVILGLCLLIAITNLSLVAWIQKIEIPGLDYSTIAISILSFWFVFTINSIIEKKSFAGKRSGLNA
jgi:uncharacterized membrane protein